MPKRIYTTRIEDQICSSEYAAKRGLTKLDAKALYGDRNPVGPAKKISYIPGGKPKPEPSTMPRLFIRGLIGGSFKIDLGGLNIGLSKSSSAQWICDESLSAIHVHRGDIAFFDPTRLLKHMDVVIVLDDGREVFRRLVKNRGLWYLKTLNGKKSPTVLLVHQPVYGVVIGFLRLCVAAKAVNYANTEDAVGNFERKMPTSGSKTGGTPEISPHRTHSYTRTKRSPFILTSERGETGYARLKSKKCQVKKRAQKRAVDA